MSQFQTLETVVKIPHYWKIPRTDRCIVNTIDTHRLLFPHELLWNSENRWYSNKCEIGKTDISMVFLSKRTLYSFEPHSTIELSKPYRYRVFQVVFRTSFYAKRRVLSDSGSKLMVTTKDHCHQMLFVARICEIHVPECNKHS